MELQIIPLIIVVAYLVGMMIVGFGCAVSVVVFFVVNAIERKRGVEPAPSAYID